MDHREKLKLKINLLLNGVRLGNSFEVHARATLESISEGLNIDLGNGVYVTSSINNRSAFVIYKTASGYDLRNGELSLRIELITPPNIQDLTTTDGTPLNKVGTFQLDRARISAFKGCIFGVLNVECKFCEIGDLKKMRKNKLKHINEFISYVEQQHKQIRHFLVSGGTPSDKGWGHFIDVCKEIKSVSEKPIYAMFSPPHTLGIIDELVQSGVSEIAINLEFYNNKFAKDIIPGKAAIGRESYFESLEHAVKLLGSHGAVRSILIVGIESQKDTLKGVEELASRGVVPILSIFKPLKGTKMEYMDHPDLELLLSTWEQAQKICELYSLTLGPLCPHCQNNTLTIPINAMYDTVK